MYVYTCILRLLIRMIAVTVKTLSHRLDVKIYCHNIAKTQFIYLRIALTGGTYNNFAGTRP